MFLHLKVYVNSFLGGRLPLFIVSVEFLTLLQTNFSCFLYVTLVLLKFFFFLNFILASLPSSILCRYIKRRFFLAACFLSRYISISFVLFNFDPDLLFSLISYQGGVFMKTDIDPFSNMKH